MTYVVDLIRCRNFHICWCWRFSWKIWKVDTNGSLTKIWQVAIN